MTDHADLIARARAQFEGRGGASAALGRELADALAASAVSLARHVAEVKAQALDEAARAYPDTAGELWMSARAAAIRAEAATAPEHAVDNASRPWDVTDDAGHEHRVTPEEG